MKKWLCSLCLIATMYSPAAYADTLLFPYIVKSTQVTTIISIMNPVMGSGFMKYIYRSKDGESSSSLCDTEEFVRPTSQNDLVSFDVSGVFSDGDALFLDGNHYFGSFALSAPGAKRAYLLVSHSDAYGRRIDAGEGLAGEAVIIDIGSGGAWGYRALNDRTREDYSFSFSGTGNSLYPTQDACLPPVVPEEEPSCYPSVAGGYRAFSFFKMPEWKTKFFVTPIGTDMNTNSLRAKVKLVSSVKTAVGEEGVYRRIGGSPFGITIEKEVSCVAAFELEDLIESTDLAQLADTGGWTYFFNSGRYNLYDAEPDRMSPVVVFKLDYTLSNPAYGGTVNNGYCLSCGN